MTTPFADHFAHVAAGYADHRPTYPDALFDWLASVTPSCALAWDCGAGSGQASMGLARCFERVIATDASREQIARASPHPRIEYRVAPAERSGLADGSADLVTVAQALHWFDVEQFHREACRVLKRHGVIAEWSYGAQHVDRGAVDAEIGCFYRDVVGPYWPPERVWVETGYSTLSFPFPRVPAPEFGMQALWTLAQLLGYLRSWSATARYHAAIGVDPVDALARTLTPLWGDPHAARLVTWDLTLRVGRV